MEDGGEKLLDTIELRFDDGLAPQFHIPFNPVFGAVFLQNLRGYLESAHLLVSTSAEMNEAYEDTGDWVLYPWERDIPGFTYREELSVDENLKALAAAAPEAEPPSTALAEYYGVLTQDALYSPYPYTEPHTIHDLGDSLTAADFALQDLNADGLPEMLLNLQDSAGTPAAQLLLSWQVGTLTGLELPAGAISDLRTDGSFLYQDEGGEHVPVWRILLGDPLLNGGRFALFTGEAPVPLSVLGEGEPVTFYPVSQAAEVLLS